MNTCVVGSRKIYFSKLIAAFSHHNLDDFYNTGALQCGLRQHVKICLTDSQTKMLIVKAHAKICWTNFDRKRNRKSTRYNLLSWLSKEKALLKKLPFLFNILELAFFPLSSVPVLRTFTQLVFCFLLLLAYPMIHAWPWPTETII